MKEKIEMRKIKRKIGALVVVGMFAVLMLAQPVAADNYDTDGDGYVGNGGEERIFFDDDEGQIEMLDANVGIGVTDPWYAKLTVNGLVHINGDIELWSGADRSISVGTAINSDGYDLTVKAGNGIDEPIIDQSYDGGHLHLTGGDGYGFGQQAYGGNVYIYGGGGTFTYDGNVILAHTSSEGRGKVGIGTTSPTQLLHVYGKIRIGNDATSPDAGTIRWTGSNFEGYTGSAWVPLDVQSTSGGGWTRDDGTQVVRLTTSSDKVGIGTTSPQNKLDVEGGAAVGASYSGSSSAPSNGLIVEGSVGIGTTDPSRKLEVRESTNPQLRLTQSDAFYTDLQTTSSGYLYINPNGGRVGIGTASPDARLHSLATTEQLRLGYDASNYASFTVASDGALAIQTTGTDEDIEISTGRFDNAIFIDDSASSIGVGTDSPDEKFEIEWSADVDFEIGRGTTDTDITFITLRDSNGTQWYIFPTNVGTLQVTQVHP